MGRKLFLPDILVDYYEINQYEKNYSNICRFIGRNVFGANSKKSLSQMDDATVISFKGSAKKN